MRRTLFRSFMTGSLALGILPAVLATSAHAQAPSRPASGSYYDVSALTPARDNPAAPARARAVGLSADSDYRAASLTPVPSGGYYYQTRRPAAPPARDYYAPAAGYPARDYFYAPAIGYPAQGVPSTRPGPRPRADDDDYAYKS